MNKFSLLLVTCIVLGLLTTACSTGVTPATPPIVASSPLPAASAISEQTSAPTAMLTRTLQPTASRAASAPTEIPVPSTRGAPTATIPGDWCIPVVSVPDLIGNDYYIPTWDEQNRLLNWIGNAYQSINPITGQVETAATPTATPALGIETISTLDQFAVACSSDSVKMIRRADQIVVAEAQLPMECYLDILWAYDGSAAAFITQRGELYVWQPDGSPPVKIADGVNYSAPKWSPDNTRILFLDQIPGIHDATIAGLRVVDRAGKPQFQAEAQVEVGNQWDPNSALTWETNTLIRSRRCGMDYCFYDYYDAPTGRFIIRATKDEGGGREPSISPDGRWLVMEADTRATNWEQRWEIYNTSREDYPTLLVIDLETLRRSLAVQSRTSGIDGENLQTFTGDDSLKFMGWNAESSKFYLIHFPFGAPDYDLPVGLLALYPNNGYIEPVMSGIAFGLASPNARHIFLGTAETIEKDHATGVDAGIYDLDGSPITTPQRVAEPMEYSTLNDVDVYSTHSNRVISSEWSPDGSQLVYADGDESIWLIDTVGNTTELAVNLPEDVWDRRAIFSWSPDGHFLLIKGKTQTWIADISAGQHYPGEMKYYYCSTLVDGSEGTRESPYGCGNDAKVAQVIDLVCKQGGGTLYVHHAGMTSNFYEVLLISPNCQVQKKGEFEGSPPSH